MRKQSATKKNDIFTQAFVFRINLSLFVWKREQCFIQCKCRKLLSSLLQDYAKPYFCKAEVKLDLCIFKQNFLQNGYWNCNIFAFIFIPGFARDHRHLLRRNSILLEELPNEKVSTRKLFDGRTSRRMHLQHCPSSDDIFDDGHHNFGHRRCKSFT